MLTNQFLPMLNSASGETGAALYPEYAGLTVPVINIIMEGLTLILLIGAAFAGILLLRHHVKKWLYPLVVGIAFNMVFQYIMFNQRYGLLNLGSQYLTDNVEFFQNASVLLDMVLIVLQAGFTFLTIVLGFGYWKKTAQRDNRPFSLGGAMAFGFSFYIVSLFTNEYIMAMYELLSQSQIINSYGFEEVLKDYIANGMEEELVLNYLLSLTADDPVAYVHFALEALIMIFGAFTTIAASVLFYGYRSGALEKKWILASATFCLASFVPTILVLVTGRFPAYIYIELAYSILLAAASAFTVYYVSTHFMPDEWKALGYTRTMQKRDEEKEKNKIPKIVMPKD